MASRGAVVRNIRIEKLGVVQTWILRDEPFKGQPKRRAAYEAGFTQRSRDWSQGVETPVGPRYRNGADDEAWELGYGDAKEQDMAP